MFLWGLTDNCRLVTMVCRGAMTRVATKWATETDKMPSCCMLMISYYTCLVV